MGEQSRRHATFRITELKYRGDEVGISSFGAEVETVFFFFLFFFFVHHIFIIIDRWIMDFLRRGNGRGLGGFP